MEISVQLILVGYSLFICLFVCLFVYLLLFTDRHVCRGIGVLQEPDAGSSSGMHGGEESVGEEETKFGVQSGLGSVYLVPEGDRHPGPAGIHSSLTNRRIPRL